MNNHTTRTQSKRPTRAMRRLQSLLLLCALTALAPLSARAANLVVSTTADGGVGSLRQAITDANATPDNDAISFSTSGTITLTGGVLPRPSRATVAGTLAITGPAAGITISGNNASRIFFIDGGANLSLNNLTLRDGRANGDAGGAIFNGSSSLTVTGCTFTNNVAGFGGGAIFSTTDGVSAANPDPAVSVLLRNCTLFGNRVDDSRGGAIYNNNGLMRIESCTISGNSAPINQAAGVASFGDDATRTRIQNSIVAGNLVAGGAPDSGTDVDLNAPNSNFNTFVSQGNNLIGDGQGASRFNGAGDRTGITAAQLNLSAPVSNGGPTFTLALRSGSVAIDKGATTLTTDQRGFARDSKADIGAFEFGATNATNTPPVLNNATYTAGLNVPFSVQLVGTDVDGDALTYAVAPNFAAPAGLTLSSTGVLSGTPGTVGTARFSVTVSDGKGGTVTGKFAIAVRNVAAGTDLVAPTITRNTLPASATRNQYAGLTLSGLVADRAQAGVTASGVRRVLAQLRSADSTQAFNGTAFTTDLTQGYYVSTVSAGGPTDNLTYTRTLNFLPQSLAPGNYVVLLYPQDNAGNYAAEYIAITVTASAPITASPLFSSGHAS